MNRFILNSLALFTAGAGMIGCSPQMEETQRPNILYIMSDDHAFQAISAYSGYLAELAPTPNIDRLASEGAIFTRATVTNSICSPSIGTRTTFRN